MFLSWDQSIACLAFQPSSNFVRLVLVVQAWTQCEHVTCYTSHDRYHHLRSFCLATEATKGDPSCLCALGVNGGERERQGQSPHYRDLARARAASRGTGAPGRFLGAPCFGPESCVSGSRGLFGAQKSSNFGAQKSSKKLKFWSSKKLKKAQKSSKKLKKAQKSPSVPTTTPHNHAPHPPPPPQKKQADAGFSVRYTSEARFRLTGRIRAFTGQPDQVA